LKIVPPWKYDGRLPIKTIDNNGILWKIDIHHRHWLESKVMPYKIPNLYFLKDEPAPIEVKKIKITNEPVESLKPNTGLFA
jgi:hypothetical protein